MKLAQDCLAPKPVFAMHGCFEFFIILATLLRTVYILLETHIL